MRRGGRLSFRARSREATPAGYGPADLRDAYRLPADGGAGQTIAVVAAFDAPTAEADLAVYRDAVAALVPRTCRSRAHRAAIRLLRRDLVGWRSVR
ncbi:hypothetical protein [Nonomuraea cypriaca]|uniref:hypothetical protein n=1 Tax=Nonomuraea cypriaca TaxID=1187855 RepID=UPI001A9C83BF|nr:hypothetical protein [Nonomuraea cypriaca]